MRSQKEKQKEEQHAKLKLTLKPWIKNSKDDKIKPAANIQRCIMLYMSHFQGTMIIRKTKIRGKS